MQLVPQYLATLDERLSSTNPDTVLEAAVEIRALLSRGESITESCARALSYLLFHRLLVVSREPAY